MTACLDTAVGRAADPALLVEDAEFRDMVPPPGPAERARLVEALFAPGPHEPLLVWPRAGRLVVLVGYDRLPLVRRYALPCRVFERAFATRDDARQFVIRHLLARPRLAPLVASYLRGLRYAAAKRSAGGRRPPCGFGTGKTAEALAELFGVDPATIRRDGDLADAVERIVAACGSDAKPLLFDPGARVRHGQVLALADLPPDEQRAALAELRVTGRLPGPPRAAEPRTITLPYEPHAFAAALVRRFGPERAAAYAAALLAAVVAAEDRGQTTKDGTCDPPPHTAIATDYGLRTEDNGPRPQSLGTKD